MEQRLYELQTLLLPSFPVGAVSISEEVWKILREKSQLKLALLETLQGPSRLKTFADHMERAKRLELQHKSRWQKIHTRVVLMYKASESNTDRTALLMANNPTQNPTEMDGGDSPAKYLPCELFTKRMPVFSHQHSLPALTHPFQITTGSLKDTSGLGSRSSGLPNSHSVHFPAPKSTVSSNQVGTEGSHTSIRAARGQSTSLWEPLDFSSLLKVSPAVTAPGRGAFRCGQTAYWRVTSSTDAETIC
ncbi:uncharacterized protein LOC118803258 [Colossoma macropomum]|uniref:uncharacterized protein LOC118803258 n=1 Tax=Colossoma macropomum TaxID=42526 RepID=UPI00186472C5|nr:uncharacterized protein LOC118803258 [Colossoma macropomum]